MGRSCWAVASWYIPVSAFPHHHFTRENIRYLGNQPLGSMGSVFGVCLFWLWASRGTRNEWDLRGTSGTSAVPRVLLAGCSLHLEVRSEPFAAGQSLFGLRWIFCHGTDAGVMVPRQANVIWRKWNNWWRVCPGIQPFFWGVFHHVGVLFVFLSVGFLGNEASFL